MTCIPIAWRGFEPGWYFDETDQQQIIELSKHIDCFMDQGWSGTYVREDQRRKDFIKKLHCDYGTSGGIWAYHSVRWDRNAYFLPYPQRCVAGIKEHFYDGARAWHVLSGPGNQPCGRAQYRSRRTDALGHFPRGEAGDRGSGRALLPSEGHKVTSRPAAPSFMRAEDAYFGQWTTENFAAEKKPVPGQFFVCDLLGETPGRRPSISLSRT